MARGGILFLMVLAGLILALQFGGGTAPAPDDPGVISVSAADAGMNGAIEKAKSTLPMFLSKVLDRSGQMALQSTLKVGLPAVGYRFETEHVWVVSFARLPDGSFSGVLDVEPRDLGDLRIGDTIAFSQDQISDWAILLPDGLLYGGYTIREVYPGETGIPGGPAFSPSPIPDAWSE